MQISRMYQQYPSKHQDINSKNSCFYIQNNQYVILHQSNPRKTNMHKNLDSKAMARLQDQLHKERKMVSVDSYDITIQQILDMFEAGHIIVPPEYQRQFLWSEERQSQLIESAFLGIPIPNLFMATNPDSTWEVVDGVQRLCSLAHFKGGPKLLEKIGRNTPLSITTLDKLPDMKELSFSDLPSSLQLMFSTRPIRVTVLNDKSDLSVRFDLFQRLNTGGVSLSDQEIRNCVYRGLFNNDIKMCSMNKNFRATVKLKPIDEKNGMAEELVLRFFAYLNNYRKFDHSVKDFLNGYMKTHVNATLDPIEKQIFENTFAFIASELPSGITRGRNITPLNLYEAIAVGTGLCFKNGNTPKQQVLGSILSSSELKTLTTGATNSRRRVTGRIEHVLNKLSDV
jgi:hypothetical protein